MESHAAESRCRGPRSPSRRGFVPIQDYDSGGGNDLMLVRLCAVFEPIFPTVGLGAELARVNESDYAIVAAIAYTNEPI